MRFYEIVNESKLSDRYDEIYHRYFLRMLKKYDGDQQRAEEELEKFKGKVRRGEIDPITNTAWGREFEKRNAEIRAAGEKLRHRGREPYSITPEEHPFAKALKDIHLPGHKLGEGSEGLSYIGNCTDDDVIEELFGDATMFAQAVEEYGDEFTDGDLVVKYDPDEDIHSFYWKN